MPMLTKRLYKAKNMEALLEMTNVDFKTLSTSDTQKLCISAKKLLQEAEKKHKENDEEMAFVYYCKFVDLVLYLKKKPNFHSIPASEFLSQSATSAMDKATELKESLSQRYKSLSAVNEQREIKMDASSPKLSSKENAHVPSVSSLGDPEKSAKLGVDAAKLTISTSELYHLMLDSRSTFLILDVRPERDFDESHIKHSACINVPQEILTPGLTGPELEKMLPSPTEVKWSMRNTVDCVIILDWDTCDRNLSPTHPITTLENAMIKWDSKNPLNKHPVILIGGYKDWLMRYPMHTTKALNVFSLDAPKHKSVISGVSGVDYPDLESALVDEIGPATVENNRNHFFGSGHKARSEKMVNGWIKEDIHSAQDVTPQHLVNRLNKPNVPSSSIFSPGLQNENSSKDKMGFAPNDAKTTSKNKVPEFNRSLKPSWAVKSEKFSDGLDMEKNAIKETLTITEQELNKEREFAQLRLRKELEAEESMRIELQKQEELLLESLKRLQAENCEHEARYQAMKEENVQMKKLLEAQSNEEQTQKEKDIEKLATKREDMLKEVERLRQERKIKEQIEAASKAKSQQLPEIKSENDKPRDYPKDQVKHRPESEYTVPLKDTGSSTDSSSRGLTRSYSSPNIAQMVAEAEISSQRKTPTVDRSLKPKYDFTFNSTSEEMSSVKIRNLNPTYGNVPCRPVTGLRNLGNTCYMNSSIQVLSNTLQLANYFIQNKYRQHIRRNNKLGTHGEIVEEFAVIIRALWAGQYRYFSPKDFKNTASKYIPMCVGYEQQDSHEFLVVLMDKIHGDLNQGHNVEPLPNLDSLSDSDATEKFWAHYKMKNHSKISDIFEGLLKSTLSCLSCKKTSNSYEVFSCLSLPISSSRCTLQDSLTTFLKPEKMSGEGAWDCPGCRRKKDAEKTLVFCKPPEVLIIQLKRFSYDGMWRRKIQVHVEFPMKLELPYESNRMRIYSLYAVVNHFGSLEGGHYTAICKNPTNDKWYKYDDHEVTEVIPVEIVTSAAYMLFYSSQETRM